MNIALLNERILVQAPNYTVDAIGNHLTEWEDYYSCAATVSGESGEEADDAGTTVDNAKVDFTIRWCGRAERIQPTEHRVLFHGGVYDILAVDHMNYKRKSIKLKCRRARRL